MTQESPVIAGGNGNGTPAPLVALEPIQSLDAFVMPDGTLTDEGRLAIAPALGRIGLAGAKYTERLLSENVLRLVYERVDGRLVDFCRITGLSSRRAADVIRRIQVTPGYIAPPKDGSQANQPDYAQFQYAPSSELQLVGDQMISLSLRAIDEIHSQLDLHQLEPQHLVQLLKTTVALSTMIKGILVSGKGKDRAKTTEQVRSRLKELEGRLGIKVSDG